jgi:phenylacetate-CoA ligase
MWDASIETLERGELAQLQLERLQATLFRLYRNVAFYRKRFDALGMAPEDLQSLEQLAALPLTTPDDLQAGYPYDLLAVPLREVVRLHSSSGTFSRPTVSAYSRNDVRHWHELVARLLVAAEVTRDDVVQLLYHPGQLTTSLGFHGGAERLGASVIPAAPTRLREHVTLMQDFKTTVLVGTASDAIHLATLIQTLGFDPRRLSARVAFLGGEPWAEAERILVESALQVTALDYLALDEVGGPGIAAECLHRSGLHVAEDHFLVEVIDPATGHPVAPGEPGELVVTTLTREALPLLRFRTRMLTHLDPTRCACGRTFARLARLLTRTDDLCFVAGRPLSPGVVSQVLQELEGIEPHYQLLIDRRAGADEVEILAELTPGLPIDSPGKVLALEARIAEGVHAATGIWAKIRLVEPQTIARITGGQSASVCDRRFQGAHMGTASAK